NRTGGRSYQPADPARDTSAPGQQSQATHGWGTRSAAQATNPAGSNRLELRPPEPGRADPFRQTKRVRWWLHALGSGGSMQLDERAAFRYAGWAVVFDREELA